MKTDHIPMLSYIFIGVTSLVLTYATIADTTNEVIIEPMGAPESGETSSMIPSVSLPEVSIPSFSDTVEKMKSLNPFNSSPNETSAEAQTPPPSQLPVAVAVPANSSSTTAPSAPPAPAYGGNKRSTHKKRKQTKPKNTRRTKK